MQSALNISLKNAMQELSISMANYISTFDTVEEHGYIRVILGNPYQPEYPLEVETDMEEISVYFGESHIHLSPERESTSIEETTSEAVEAIRRILEGADVSYGAYRSSKSLGGGFVSSPVTLGKLKQSFSNADKFTIIGWKHHDQQPEGA